MTMETGNNENKEKKVIPMKIPSKSVTLIADNFSGLPKIGDLFSGLSPDLAVWANLYIKIQVDGIKSSETLRAVRVDLGKFINFFSDYHHSLDINHWLPKTTARFVEYLESMNLRPKTIQRNLVTLRSFAKWIFSLRKDLFPLGDPTRGIKPPTQEAMRPKCLDDRQIKRVIDAAFHLICQNYPDAEMIRGDDRNELWFQKGHRSMRRPLRDFAIIMLMLNGGLRRAEICSLNLDNLKDKHLRNVKCKGNMFRDVLLGDETIKSVQTYLQKERLKDAACFPGTDALFLPSGARKYRNHNNRLSVRTVNFIVDTIAREANKNLPLKEQKKSIPTCSGIPTPTRY